jgi:1-acyl-sn-glycerol-3-phosphate acyltransferase
MADLWDALRGKPVGNAIGGVVGWMLLRSLRRSLRGVYVKGEVPREPMVLALNHHSFFDGHIVWLLGRLYRVPTTLLVAPENVKGYPMLKLAGALEAHRVREALRRLSRGEWVAVFPEGEMRCSGELAPLRLGAEYLARKAGVPLLPIAVRVLLRGFEHPEAFLLVREPIRGNGGLAATLGALLRELDQVLRSTHPRVLPEGFRCVLSGRLSLEERLEPLVKLFRRR